MNPRSYCNSSTKIISETVHQEINEKDGKIFKNNLIELLQSQLKWTIGEIPRTFFYRELLYKTQGKFSGSNLINFNPIYIKKILSSSYLMIKIFYQVST